MCFRSKATHSVLVLCFICSATSQTPDLDADLEECGSSSRPSGPGTVLLDSQRLASLESLWFADDESLDLFAFPVPEDPVRWELSDASSCRNVWQYCGQSSTDILITQFLAAAPAANNSRGGGGGGEATAEYAEVVVSLEYAFFGKGTEEVCSTVEMDDDGNVLIVEVDDTTGLDNLHTERIPQCLGNRSSYRHDFLYQPMSQRFEIVFRSNLSAESCINISRVHVFSCSDNHYPVQDPNSTHSTITCRMCPTGHYLDTELAECFPCPDFSSSDGGRQCVCNEGYQRAVPGNSSLPCDQCVSGYFPADNMSGLCLGCPLPGFENPGSQVDACRCFNQTLDASGLACQSCAANYIRNSSSESCVLCPAGSRRSLTTAESADAPAETLCTCTEGSLTQSQQNVTTREICDNCSEPLFWNGTQCSFCPSNSQPSQSDQFCVCDTNTLTLAAGQNVTTTQPCACVDGFYRFSNSAHCSNCPANSFRELRDPEQICPCFEGFGRSSNSNSNLDCFRYVGFSTNSLLLAEGDGQQSNYVTVSVSLRTADPLSVSVVLLTGNPGVQVRPESAAFGNETSRDFVLSHVGNTVALEDNVTLNLSLTASRRDILIGGPGLFGHLGVVIRDDDMLHVGFTESMLFYEASAETGSIGVNISARIGRNLLILFRVNDTLSPNFNPSQPQEITFSPQDPTSQQLEFAIMVDQEGATPTPTHVLLSLEVATYPQSLDGLRDRISVGGLPGLHLQAVVVVQGGGAAGSGSGLSRSALIGVVCSVVVVCFNVALVLLLVSVCLCHHNRPRQKRKQQVKGQARESDDVEMTKLQEIMDVQEDKDQESL